MKINFPQLSAFVFAIVISWFVLFMTTGCSATYHLTKYQKKGGVCGQIDTVKVIDSVLIYDEIRDTMYFHYFNRDSVYVVNDRVVPKTRLEIRTEYKIHRDTIKLHTTTIKEQARVDKSNSRNWLSLAIFLFGALVVVYLLIRQLKKIC